MRRWILTLTCVAACADASTGRGPGEYDPEAEATPEPSPEAPAGGELPLPEPTDGPDDGAPGPAVPISEDDEAAMLALTNGARAAEGLPPLLVYWDLVDDARLQAAAMIDNGGLFHNPALASVTAAEWTKLGENVGVGASPALLQPAFMNSPAHRANILEPDYDYIGIGGIRDDSGTLWIALVFMGSPLAGLQDTLGPFHDDDASIFEASIKKIYDAGITVGCSPAPNPAFCPDATVTRAQMAVFLDRALSLPAATDDYFGDDDGQWYEDAVNRIAEAGITVGCGEDTYCGNDEVTRGQMAAFLSRALELPPSGADHFIDDDGRFYEESANRMKDAGITLGCNQAGTLYCGDDPVTRGQMAAFLDRALGL